MFFGLALGIAISFLILPKLSWTSEIPGGDPYKELYSSSPSFQLADPETAGKDLPLVMQGYRLMLETKKYAPEYAGDRISCTNCHFNAGNTLGGLNGGISLVGVTKKYPKPLPNGSTYTLAARINACFEKSINGKPLPEDGPYMQALLAYLDWISLPAANHTPSWLGLKPLSTNVSPDPNRGAELYIKNCALCHGKDGQGQPRKKDLSYPPLWGEHSFNQSAGMNKISTLSSFVFYNMPYGEPSLTTEEATHVASFINKQSRPK